MKIIDKQVANNQTTYLLEVNQEQWIKAQKKQRNKLVANLSIPGFRKGKVPSDIANKHISNFQVINEATNSIINDVLKDFWKEFDTKKDTSIIENSMQIGFDKVDENNLIIKLTFANMPNVTIDKLDSINVKYTKPTASDKEIDFELNNLISQDAMIIPKDNQVIAKGDMVKFDFKGYLDNKPFPGGEAKDFDLEIGSGRFIPGFEDQMVGLKKDESKRIKVSFPKDYHAKEMAGKDAEFEIKIKEISSIQKPTLDEKYLAKFNFKDVKNEQDLRKYLANQIIRMKNYSAKQEAIQSINEYLIKNAKLSYLPDYFLNTEVEHAKNDIINRAKAAKIDFKDYIINNLHYKDEIAFNEQLKKDAIKRITLMLTITHLVKEFKIQVSDADIENELRTMSANYGMKLADIKNNPELIRNISMYLINERLYDKLIELNTKK